MPSLAKGPYPAETVQAILRADTLDDRQRFALLSRDRPKSDHRRPCHANTFDCVCIKRSAHPPPHTCACGSEWATSTAGVFVPVTFPGGVHKPQPKGPPAHEFTQPATH